jgi:hypothetical protein
VSLEHKLDDLLAEPSGKPVRQPSDRRGIADLAALIAEQLTVGREHRLAGQICPLPRARDVDGDMIEVEAN